MVGGGVPGEAATTALVPMEVAVRALIEHLVGPLLPGRVSSQAPPTIEQQEFVAKQMHSVVLLYNYYHRKRFPELRFLDFRAFCKEATVVKPSLLMYMKFMCKNVEYPHDWDKDLSIMEKRIIDACNISSTLDATQNAPNMEEWLVSQVAVFLVDAEKKKCYLEFGSITQGVWSLLEKKLDKPVVSLMSNIKMNKHSSVARCSSYEHSDESLEDEFSLQQFALSSVEKKTGVSRSNFSILECHMAYSLNQVKTTTKLYIMKCTEVMNDGLAAFPIKDVLCSMSGPLIRTSLHPEVTSVIEYYHLLPYVNILSDWLSRNLQNLHQCSLESDNVFTMEDHEINKSAFVDETVAARAKSISKNGNEITCKKGSSSSNRKDSSGENCEPQANAISLSAEPASAICLSAEAANAICSSTESDLLLTTKDETVYDKTTINKSTNGAKLSDVNNILPTKCANGVSLSISEPCKVVNTSSCYKFRQPSPRNEEHVSKKVTVPNACMNKRGSNIHFPPNDPSNGYTNKVDELNLAKKSRTVESNDGETFGGKEASPAFQDDVSSFGLPLVPVQLTSQNHDESNFLLSSKKHEFLQALLRILQKKRDDLVQEHRQLEEEIAQYELNIHTILIGQGSMKSNVESMIRACNALCSSQMDNMATSFCSEARRQVQELKIRRLSEAILTSKSSCQELDDICRKNGWMLPKYSIVALTADESFQASITVKGIDFETNVHGDLKSTAREARLSAASRMLSKIHSLVEQQTRVDQGC